MATIVILIIVVPLMILAYVRFAPVNVILMHQDPATTASSGKPNEYRTTSSVYDMSAPELSKMFDDFALAQPRVKRIAETLQDQMITYVQRTKIIGYPDYITIKAIPVGAKQSKLEIFSRSRFGYSDWGVNKGRIKGWLLKLR
jgi:uncharacterized protein (DUF1499 family)